MLRLTVPGYELFDESNQEFITIGEQHLELEHSLHAVALWEERHHKPFLTREEKTEEESIDYIRCMMLKPVDEIFYKYMPGWVFKKICDYMDDPMTATTIRKQNGPPSREIITAELVYYWMIAAGVPFECQYWNLNKLFTLIEVCNIKSQPPKKMGKNELRQRNTALNAARRAKLHSKG